MKIAVVGATGVVGETIMRVLEERNVAKSDIGRFASRTRADVRETTAEALAEYDVVFFAGSEDASERYVPALLDRGALVIDNSATYRMNAGVPLIVPEVNVHAIRSGDRLFPVANCTAIILCVALAPVRNAAGLSSVHVATYQAISGAGRSALEEFDRGEGNVVRNVVPHIGAFGDGGYTGEEVKVAQETRKILDLPQLHIFATAVRVPVRTAHSEAVFFRTERATDIEELRSAFAHAPGIVFYPQGVVTPREVEGSDTVHVARLRACEPDGRSFQMWIVGDQLRKGAATNGVQIFEHVLSRGAAQG